MTTTMEINKFDYSTTDSRVDLFLPIQKVDKERRIVSGFATLDNLDRHGDVVTAEASKGAFSGFRGNIREMHMPKAVGKMVNFSEKTLNQNGAEYKGIFVEVYVSKGAQDTWEKVLDGTLSGFSIGGDIKDAEPITKTDGGTGRKIKKYELVELSLVDSPANQLANVFSIQKMESGYEFTGFATEESEEDFAGDTVEKSADGQELVSAEGDDLESETEVAATNDEGILNKFIERVEDIIVKTIGGNTMTTQTEETAVEEVEVTETEEVVESVQDDTAVEKAADVSEVEVTDTEDEAVDADSLVDSIVEKVLERLERGTESNAEVAEDEESVAKSVDLETVEAEFAKSLDGVASTIKDSIEELAKTVAELKNETNERLSGLEDASAVRKSAVTGGLKKRAGENDFWGDTALGGTKTSA